MSNFSRAASLALGVLISGGGPRVTAATTPIPRVGMHVTPYAPGDGLTHAAESAAQMAPGTHAVAAATGSTYTVYLIVTHADSVLGISGLQCGLDYTPRIGNKGTEVTQWLSCANVEVTYDGPRGAWPAPGSGNRLSQLGSGCERGTVPGHEADGAVAVAGVFYVTSYSEDYFTITGNRAFTAGPKISVTDCMGGVHNVPERSAAAVRFSPGAAVPGGNPSMGDGKTEWVEKSEATVDHMSTPLGISLGDYDGDGDLDVFAAGVACRLLRNDGRGNFDLATPPALTSLAGATSGIWGDLDNDGDLDLFVGTDLADRMLRNDGGLLVDVTTPPLNDFGTAAGLAYMDFDKDGDLDLYLARTSGGSRVLRNEGNFRFVNKSNPGILADPRNNQCASFGDYDNDGDLDLHLATRSYADFLYRNEGNWAFVDVSSFPLWTPDFTHSGAWGDYDNDLDLDLFASNDHPQFNNMFRNEGGGMFADVTTNALKDPGRGRAGTWGDYDLDGDLDLFLANIYNSGVPIPCRLYRNDANVFVEVAKGPVGDTGGGGGAAWGDMDGDGALDLVVSSTWGQKTVRVLRNRFAGSGHWVRVKLEGTLSNRNAVGARITLRAGGQQQMREVTSGGGWYSQNPYEASFGLGTAEVIDTLRVRWPSGITQEFRDLPVDRVHVLREYVQVVGIPGDGGFTPRYGLAGLPNPFQRSTRLGFELPEPGTIGLEIYDVSGRRVRTLLPPTWETSGSHEVVWDGRDDQGALVTAGVYFARLAAPAGSEVQKLVRLP